MGWDAVVADDDSGWFLLGGFALVPEVQLVGKLERFERPGLSDRQKNRAWTVGANLYPFGPATRLVVEYVSRTIGDPGVRNGLVLTQAQVKF